MALLYNQPADHVEYLLQRLEEVKSLGSDNISWDSFLPPGTPVPQVYAAQPSVTNEGVKVSAFHGMFH